MDDEEIHFFRYECPECGDAGYHMVPEEGDTLTCEACGYESAPVEEVQFEKRSRLGCLRWLLEEADLPPADTGDPEADRVLNVLWFCAFTMFAVSIMIQFGLVKMALATVVGVLALFLWATGKMD